jgi:hypothetical protein
MLSDRWCVCSNNCELIFKASCVVRQSQTCSVLMSIVLLVEEETMRSDLQDE